jgi:hypothetical protein
LFSAPQGTISATWRQSRIIPEKKMRGHVAAEDLARVKAARAGLGRGV